MDPIRWKRAKTILLEALERPENTREAWVREQCGEDGDLLSEVLALLTQSASESFLEPPGETREGESERASILGGDEWTGRFVGEYRILWPIARGGMGIVFLARQESLDRIVAIKMLPWYSNLDPAQARRFDHEARAIAQVNHPHVASILSVGEVEGTRYFAMEYLPLGDLAQELVRLRGRALPRLLPPRDSRDYFRRVAELGMQVAQALAHVHERGIVHRDIKPQNLMLSTSGIKVVDFGLAKSEAFGSVTAGQQVAGTPHYMSPEQARVSASPVDHRTDLYSLGVVLYELVTLERPYRGKSSREVLQEIAAKQPRSVTAVDPRVPQDLALIIERAMEKSPRDRFGTAAAMAADLRRFVHHEAILTRAPGMVSRIRRVARRNSRVLAAGSMLLIALLLGGWGRERLARASAGRDLAAELDSAAGESSEALENRTIRDLQHLRALCESALVLPSVPGATQELARSTLQRMDRHGEARKQGLLERLDELAQGSLDPAESEWERSQALVEVARLLLLRPGDLELQRALEEPVLHPMVRVLAVDERGTAIPADVEVRRIDLGTGMPGEREALGPAPVLGHRVTPGYYRFRVHFELGGTREFTRALDRGDLPQVLTAVRQADEVGLLEDMVEYPAGTYRIPDAPPESKLALQGQVVELDAFRIDRAEVSNDDYQQFLDAHPGWPEPRYWSGDRPENFGRLPVVGLSQHDMVAYAEWRGKRLPTYAVWYRDARGREGRPYPWSLEGAPPSLLCGVPRADTATATAEGEAQERVRAWYLANARDVRSGQDLCNPEGVFHLYGNVREATETIPVVRDGTVVRPLRDSRLTCGFSWTAGFPALTLDYFSYHRMDEGSANADRGFRCAKSLDP